MKKTFVILLLFCAQVAFSENWPAYEGNFHQSSSTVDVDPATIKVKWTRRFDKLTHINDGRGWSGDGTFYSRNLTLYNGKIGLCATTTTNKPVNVACVTVLDAANGNILNCLRTNQRYGPYKSQYDACDTGFGEQVVAWDSETGYLFLSIGGDQPGRHAIDPLANLSAYTGTIQTAVGAYESLHAQWPNIRSSRTQEQSKAPESTNPRLSREDCPRSDGIDPPQATDEFPSGSISLTSGPSNKAGFFEIQPGSSYIANDRNHAHDGMTVINLANKHTGLTASYEWYQSNKSDLGFTTFKMWGGTILDKDRVYYIGAHSITNSEGGPVDTKTFPIGRYKGLRLAALKYENQNLGTNDGGYTGPGMNETAVKKQLLYDYTVNSTDPTNSWFESDTLDNTYRNKAMLVENDNIWAAWKPGLNDPVQLVRANTAGVTTYNLSVGQGMRGWDIWPNLGYANVNSKKYLVYAAFNSVRFVNYVNLKPVVAPTGPTTITIFDADAGVEKWSFELNNALGTGTYPDLRRNSYELYNELARMVVAGKYAYVAWVDTQSGPNIKLKVIAFDITSPTAPSTPPVPFVYDLGVARNTSADNHTPGGGPGNLESRVADIMAADGVLYVLINESCDLLRPGHVFAQQVVALTSDPSNPDSDSDGLPDNWENSYFASLAQNGNGDFDGDGFTNLEEYSSSTNPADRNSRLQIPSQAVSGNNFIINWQSISGIVYQVEYSADMTTWNFVSTVQANGPSTSLVDDGSATGSSPAVVPRRFYRIRIP